MPRLDAEESVGDINRFAVGSGTMTDDAKRQYLAELHAVLPRARPIRPTLAQLRAVGGTEVIEEGNRE